MKSTVLWALVALNATLLCMFLGRFMRDNAAFAQARRPGDYLMVPGEVTGGSAGVVYIVDTTNGWLTATAYDQSTLQGKLVSMQKIDLAQIFNRAAGGGDANKRNR